MKCKEGDNMRFRMTNEDVAEYRKNAIELLKKNDQYATAKAVDLAFAAFTLIEQYQWERDVALEQLEDLGICFGEKVDGVYLTKEEYDEMLEYIWKSR